MGNIEKAEKLGEPFGTATSRLRKMLLFDMATRLDEVWCFRCSYRITTLDEFSIEHKISWFGSANPRQTFFDLNNIAFSHKSCNSRAGMQELRQRNPLVGFQKGHTRDRMPVSEGMAWCGRCGEKPIENFTKNKYRWNGLQDLCKKCRSEYRTLGV